MSLDWFVHARRPPTVGEVLALLPPDARFEPPLPGDADQPLPAGRWTTGARGGAGVHLRHDAHRLAVSVTADASGADLALARALAAALARTLHGKVRDETGAVLTPDAFLARPLAAPPAPPPRDGPSAGGTLLPVLRAAQAAAALAVPTRPLHPDVPEVRVALADDLGDRLAWRPLDEDAERDALAHLAARPLRLSEVHHDDGRLWLLTSSDEYAAEQLLLPGRLQEAARRLGDRLAVGVPRRGVLLVAQARGVDLARLARTVQALHDAAPESGGEGRLTPRVLLLRGGALVGVEEVGEPGGEPSEAPAPRRRRPSWIGLVGLALLLGFLALLLQG